MTKQEFKVGDYVRNRNSGNFGEIIALPYANDYDWLTVKMVNRSGIENTRKWSLKNIELIKDAKK